MRFTNTISHTLFRILPLLLAAVAGSILVFYLLRKLESDAKFSMTLINLAPVLIGMSALFVFALMAYMYFSVIHLKKGRQIAQQNLRSATQKMHNVRNIAEILINSNIWLPGLKDYVEEDFEALTFFEVKDFYKGNSKLAIEFLQESQDFLETENLYLELKSMLQTQPKNGKIPKRISYPEKYGKAIIEKWIKYKIGSGLWYFFGYRYINFKESLAIKTISERQKNEIMSLALSIDKQAFKEDSFNEGFLFKLGEYISKIILPALHKESRTTNSFIPRKIKVLTVILGLLIVVGLLIPIVALLFKLPVILLIISYSFIFSLFFYTSIAFNQFLKYEITS